ncbi:Blue-light-activated protein [Roseibaca ekhonensis]|uniref:histidine kinase n=1 Tax=Roseinatronobacter ekhonensis TaxID=254356 RepID=A0A3B0MRA1_9RHOB|nr:PAS domain-containing hybrid sensor histidine kinase/response regulator [Roseibaca ekhonensis]SUZ33547.1 Blue-light-activated protein [Roseibaca ekhonensis]
MAPINNTRDDHRQRQARDIVLIALIIAFLGGLLGVVFGIMLGTVSEGEAWIIGLLVVVTSGLLVFVSLRPLIATRVITAILTIYFVFHLNGGAILAYKASGDLVRTVPYISWFYPLIVFHQVTNLGFYKRAISVLVSLSPTPTAVYILAHSSDSIATGTTDAIVTFLFSFFAFALCFGLFTRYRDEEIQAAARAEEAERREAELRVSEERFRLLGLATNDLIWDADLQAGKIWWSEALLDTYGYDPQAFRTNMNAWETWLHPEDRGRVIAGLNAVIESDDNNWNSEYRMVCADGRVLDVVDRGFVCRDDAGTPVRVIGSTTDVTDLRVLERKLRQSQKMEAIGQLTGGIAHDFNNLLTIIVGNAELLADLLANDPKARHLAETTMLAAESGANLTNRLLSFARLQPLAPKRLRPRDLLAGIDGLIRRTINEDIEITNGSKSDVWPIEVDPSQIENALLNLVINARDAMPDGGHLNIEATNVTLLEDDVRHYEGMQAGRYVMIAVSDTGHGMPRHISERAFDPFFTTKEVGKGSGLGLSMVWGFMRQSNGHARVYSEPDVGTTVKLYFPAAGASEMSEDSQAPAAQVVGGTERILVVEDDDMVRKHVSAQLAAAGYAVKEAATGAAALDVMEQTGPIDLLFTDVVMPGGMNGGQLAEAARLRQPGLKVLFTSGYTEDAIVHQGRLDPGVTLLSKPYRRAELVAKVRHALDA